MIDSNTSMMVLSRAERCERWTPRPAQQLTWRRSGAGRCDTAACCRCQCRDEESIGRGKRGERSSQWLRRRRSTEEGQQGTRAGEAIQRAASASIRSVSVSVGLSRRLASHTQKRQHRYITMRAAAAGRRRRRHAAQSQSQQLSSMDGSAASISSLPALSASLLHHSSVRFQLFCLSASTSVQRHALGAGFPSASSSLSASPLTAQA